MLVLFGGNFWEKFWEFQPFVVSQGWLLSGDLHFLVLLLFLGMIIEKIRAIVGYIMDDSGTCLIV